VACRGESVTAALMREQVKTIACHPEHSEGSAVLFSLFEIEYGFIPAAVAFSMLVMNSLRQATGAPE
jgi:hypothetical protein